MDAVKTFLPTINKIAKNKTKLAILLAVIGFFSLVLHGAMVIANQGILIFLLYVLLAVFALFTLIIFLILNNFKYGN